jgi:prolyl oligopeptidase
MTHLEAPRYKVLRTSLENPEFSKAEVIMPESEMVIEKITPSKSGLFIGVMDGGVQKIFFKRYGDKNKPQQMELPEGAAGYLVAASIQQQAVLIKTSSWTKGSIIYSYDPNTLAFSDSGLEPAGKFDSMAGYQSTEVKVKSHDGVMIPLSIIHKKGIELNGKNPTLLSGYGSYGLSRKVYFNPLRLVWLERGGILAIAHVRGGGEYGKQWHLAGQKLNKPNTWKDFIACAEYLIEKGYTSTPYLAGQGGSAGGILIGRTITERPDLLQAAIINVGALDMVRAETTTNGVPNIQEFGTFTKWDEFHGLYEMSAYHHVKDGEKYPSVLLTHGINDPRVDPWTSAKMTARLQAATVSGKPVLFRVSYSEGHGVGSTRTQYLQRLADQYAFLLWQFGIQEFKPKKGI